ncbi:hypothetical protein SEA_OHMYWARD_28 [Gordonia phage OhMyWard]|uniref:Minor tail protein n=1 Tax=Gordonia phage OhMyWard TaxID=2652414 RepID=A0A5P8D9Y9_9CAUD|nr:hypothetical protein HWC72_gp28 [Gordonia phage OhMyWard]QFP94910.1 hypothetical protein SEA_OHMYWARD_28 [Gordonia phage OhMyWard]
MARVTVTGFTAARMLAMEQATVIGGTIQGDELVLTTKGGQEILAGNVRGPQGVKGDPGGVPDATNSTKGGVRLQGNLGGTAATPTITGALDGTVDASLAIATTPNPAGGNFSASLRQIFAAARVAVSRSGRTTTLWSGTMSEYTQIPEATRNAEGFIAVVLND